MKFLAYCPHCEIRVNADTMLSGSELHLALDSSGEIHISHVAKVDHQWQLNNHEKQTLRNRIVFGSLPEIKT
jgi:hypothetical protein